MARHIGALIEGHAGSKHALLGHFANSISFEAHLPSYNDSYRNCSIEHLMKRYEPDYYVCFGPVEKINPLDEYYESAEYLSRNYSLVYLAHYNVLGNYYRNKPIYLYRIDKKEVLPHQSAIYRSKTVSTSPLAMVLSRDSQ